MKWLARCRIACTSVAVVLGLGSMIEASVPIRAQDAATRSATHGVGAPENGKSPAPAVDRRDSAPWLAERPDPRPTTAAPEKHASSDVVPSFATRPHRELLRYSESEEATWVSGRSYKARFDREGAAYLPRFGESAAKNFEVGFRLESATIGGQELAFDRTVRAHRDGERVTYERGPLTEAYDLRSDSIEQTFVFPSLPAEGELVLRIATDGDFVPSDAGDELRFENEHGGVRYGRAVAVDALGQRADAATKLADGVIEIRVDAGFLARAAMPLTVDPVISTFAIHTAPSDQFRPDVAYDVDHDVFLVVYEVVFSAVDHDVFWDVLSPTGALLDFGLLDGRATDYWANPKVASRQDAHAFLVVAQVGSPTGGARSIRAREIDQGIPIGWHAATDIVVDGGEFGDKLNPDVGGGIGTSLSLPWVVVWERVFSASDRDIHARRVSVFGSTVGPTIFVDDSAATFDTNPSITKHAFLDWNVVWERRVGTIPPDHDIHFACINYDGSLSTPSMALLTGSADDRAPSVSSWYTGGRWMAVCQRDFALSLAKHDVVGVLGSGSTVLDVRNLSVLESAAGSGTLAEDQVTPSVDTDGTGFVVAYSESYLGSAVDYDVYVSTFTPVGSRIFLTEGHQNLAFSGSLEDRPEVVGMRPALGPEFRCFVVWQDQTGAGNHDIEGGLYDCEDFTRYCFPGDDAIACPCGNPPSTSGRGCQNSAGTGGAFLAQTGTSKLAGDSVAFQATGQTATATSVFLQGTALANATFGQGVRCTGGSLLRLYVKTAVGGATTAPVAGDASVSARSAALGSPLFPGDTRYYFVYYRDPIVLGGCPAASTFNTTLSGALTWRP